MLVRISEELKEEETLGRGGGEVGPSEHQFSIIFLTLALCCVCYTTLCTSGAAVWAETISIILNLVLFQSFTEILNVNYLQPTVSFLKSAF